MNETRGVVYIASGEKYIEEAKTSVKSLKKHNPELEATLYTNDSINPKEFDQIKQIERPVASMSDSLINPEMMPYDKNLFLDSDTYVNKNISELFSVLDKFDILFCHNPGGKRIKHLPKCFRKYNTGVIAYKNNQEIEKLFKKWEEYQEKSSDPNREYRGGNQAAFARAVYESQPGFLTLPPEYNVRIPVCGTLDGEVKILHGRPRNTTHQKIIKKLNKKDTPKVHYPTQSLIGTGRKTKKHTISYKIQTLTKIAIKDGLTSAIQKIRNYRQ